MKRLNMNKRNLSMLILGIALSVFVGLLINKSWDDLALGDLFSSNLTFHQAIIIPLFIFEFISIAFSIAAAKNVHKKLKSIKERGLKFSLIVSLIIALSLILYFSLIHGLIIALRFILYFSLIDDLISIFIFGSIVFSIVGLTICLIVGSVFGLIKEYE